MATIVQNYNPWREQLAANLLTPLIGDMIKRSQEANMNAKYNSLYNTVISSVSGEQQTQPDVNLLSTPAAPEGYNSNGWAKSFHNEYTPFTQFDIGTQSLTRQPVGRATPTPQDILSSLGEQIGTSRYNMLSYTNAYKMLEPAIKLAEQNRLQERGNSVITALGNATTPQEQFNTLLGGLARGDITNETMEAWRKNNEFNNPHAQPVQINAGDEVYLAGYNPKNQEYSISGSVPVGLSPSQVSDIALRTRGYDIQERKNAQDYISDQNDYSLEQDKLTETKRHNTALEEIAGVKAKNTATKTSGKPSWGAEQKYKRIANDNKELEKRLFQNGERIKKIQEQIEGTSSLEGNTEDYQNQLEILITENKNLQEQIYNNDAVLEAMEEQYGFSNTQQEYTPLGDNNGDMLPPVPQNLRPNGNVVELQNQSQFSPTPLGNVASDDVRPQPQQRRNMMVTPLNIQEEIINSNTSGGNMKQKESRGIMQCQITQNGEKLEFEIPSDAIYNEKTDADIDPRNIYNAQQFYKVVKNLQKENPNLTTLDIVKAFYRQGYKLNMGEKDR